MLIGLRLGNFKPFAATQRLPIRPLTLIFGANSSGKSSLMNLQYGHEFLKTLMRAGYRHSDLITSQMTLLYTYTLFLIGRRDYQVEKFTSRNLMAR